MMQLESLEELRVFVQIVESGSMTAAASALGLPANTVSRRLAALEQRLGCALLHRTTRSQSLSESGRTLLARSHDILNAVDAAETALGQDADALAGTVRIGVPSILTADLLASLRPLLQANPLLVLDVAVHDTPVNPVAAGLDVLVLGGTLPDSTLVIRKLVDVQLVLAASLQYLEAAGEPKQPFELSHHPTLHFKMDPLASSMRLVSDDGQVEVIPVSPRLQVDDGRALLDGLVAGLGIGATSSRLLRASPSLRQVLPGWCVARFPVHAIFPASGQRSARLRAVIACLEQALSDAP